MRHQVEQAPNRLAGRVDRRPTRGDSYTTNLPVEDLIDGKGMVTTRYDGEPLPPEHGGPARLLVPHLYLWKSAKWARRLRYVEHDEPGFWESLG